MPTFLAPIGAKISACFGGKTMKWVAIGIVILALAGTIFAGYRYVSNLQESNAELAADKARIQGELTAAQQAALANFKAYERTLDRANAQTKLLDDMFASKAALDKQLRNARDNVSKAAALPDGDAPLAPALEEALSALRSVKP